MQLLNVIASILIVHMRMRTQLTEATQRRIRGAGNP
jgi:hypothetical protein